MLRPLSTTAAIVAAALLAAPSIMTVGDAVERLEIYRRMPWELWKWDLEPGDDAPPDCDHEPVDTESSITRWPRRILKHASFELGGQVIVPSQLRRGVEETRVDVFLNETKTAPGILLGTVYTDSRGQFSMSGTFPEQLSADKYHLVAHSYEKIGACKVYREHWSDPEMEILAPTRLELELPEAAVVGENTTIQGRLLDSANASVRAANLTVTIDRERHTVTTDEEGRFTLPYEPTEATELRVSANYPGTRYYGRSTVSGSFPIDPSRLVVDLGGNDSVDLSRGELFNLSGRVRNVQDPSAEVLLRFEGAEIAPCAGCPLQREMRVRMSPTGNFTATLLAPAGSPLEPFVLNVSTPEIREPVAVPGRIVATVQVDVGAIGDPLRGVYKVRVRVLDDAGAPPPGTVMIQGPLGPVSLPLNETGEATYLGEAPCGDHNVLAEYGGGETHRANEGRASFSVCPYLAWVPAWFWATPAWVWPAGIAAAALTARIAYGARRRFSPTLDAGPPLLARVVDPADDAREIIGVGEPIVLEARLEKPLEPGWRVRFAMRGQRHREATSFDSLVARATFRATKSGNLAVRAEIVDAKGRVLTRRTVPLRAVRYAEEIERRHVKLAGSTLGVAARSATPRDVHRSLVRRLPFLRPATIGALTHVFEEADYGPREATRQDLLAYLRAERGLREAQRLRERIDKEGSR